MTDTRDDAPDDAFGDGYRPSRQDEKLQRWTDLLAALLVRTQPVTFERLREEVPGYRSDEDDVADEAERRRRRQGPPERAQS